MYINRKTFLFFHSLQCICELFVRKSLYYFTYTRTIYKVVKKILFKLLMRSQFKRERDNKTIDRTEKFPFQHSKNRNNIKNQSLNCLHDVILSIFFFMYGRRPAYMLLKFLQSLFLLMTWDPDLMAFMVKVSRANLLHKLVSLYRI